VTDDARKLGERNWRNAARNRDSWQKLLRKALAQKRAVVLMMVMMMTSVDFSDREEHVARQTKTFINTQRQ
jgi:hypothetical protein